MKVPKPVKNFYRKRQYWKDTSYRKGGRRGSNEENVYSRGSGKGVSKGTEALTRHNEIEIRENRSTWKDIVVRSNNVETNPLIN